MTLPCPHDCVVSKLVAGRERDFTFDKALIRERLIDPKILSDRVAMLDGAHPLAAQRITTWLTLFLG